MNRDQEDEIRWRKRRKRWRGWQRVARLKRRPLVPPAFWMGKVPRP